MYMSIVRSQFSFCKSALLNANIEQTTVDFQRLEHILDNENLF